MGLSKEARKRQLNSVTEVVELLGRHGHVTTRQLSVVSNKIAERVPLTMPQAAKMDALMKNAESRVFSAEDIEAALDSSEVQEKCMNRVLYRVGEWVFPRSMLSDYKSYIYAYRCWPPPLFSPTVIALCICIYILAPYEQFVDYGIRPCNAKYVYPYFTNMFFHSSLPHLISNLVILALCSIKELVHHYRIITIFILSGIGSSLIYVIFARDDIPSIGMSGAIYGLLAIHISDIFLNWSEMPFRFVRLLIIFGFLISVNYDLIFGGASVYDSRISHFAHFGGFFFGLPLGVVFLKNLQVREYDVVARTSCAILLPVLFLVAIGMNVFQAVHVCGTVQDPLIPPKNTLISG
ncbi:hypothetical protein QR680_015162 [Steinernema hermaphroditum]|uniref:Peptidase S54 rhomboid domain-containing protein n=1 Tax=Steinernema hermaphroditum TaxID=289476 RepID=A0AA39M4F8_9BILA|nr:hypothetical protein QR680_015162 [Steinernema hermaphroditum]